MTDTAVVRVGQLWRDRDRRMKGVRHLRVDAVGEAYAICWACDTNGCVTSRRKTRIKLERFRVTSTGYDLVRDAA